MDIRAPSRSGPGRHQGDQLDIGSRIHILLSTGVIETHRNQS